MRVALLLASASCAFGGGAPGVPTLASRQGESIFVTTADGPEGFAMATTLLRLGGDGTAKVIAGVGDATSPNAVALRAAGAEVRVVAEPPAPAAFAGASWIFVLAPLTADRLARGRGLIDAARAAGVASAALLSVIGAGPAAPASLGAYYALEMHLAEVWPAQSRVVLRTYFYQQNLLLWSADVRVTGALRLPLASACFAPLYEPDVAAVLLAITRSRPSAAMGRALQLTGPRVMGGEALARTASEAAGVPGLRFEAVGRAEAARTLETAAGLDPSEASLLLDLLELQARPEACKEYPSADVAAMTGRDATDVGTFFAEHAAAFRPARPARRAVAGLAQQMPAGARPALQTRQRMEAVHALAVVAGVSGFLMVVVAAVGVRIVLHSGRPGAGAGSDAFPYTTL